jgi:hypothetical protein
LAETQTWEDSCFSIAIQTMASRFVVADNDVFEELKLKLLVKTQTLEKVQIYGLELLRNGQH